MKRLFIFLYYVSVLSLVISCSSLKGIKDGQTAYQAKQYSVAIPMLASEFNSAKSSERKAQLALWTAESHGFMGQTIQELEWYRKAAEYGYGPIAQIRQAFALKKLQRYSEAKNLFHKLDTETTSSYDFKREISICRLSENWLNNIEKMPYRVESAGFNTEVAEYAPFLANNTQLFFTSDREDDIETSIYKWTGRNFSNIFIYDLRSKEVQKLEPTINTDDNNEGTITIGDNGNQLIFTRCISNYENSDDYCKLFASDMNSGQWSEPEILPFIEEGINYGHPHWVQSDSILFYTSKQEGGYGGYDIYFVKLDVNGEWSRPIALSPKINTMGDEKFPSFQNDTLYFASDGHPGMGGLDIFYTFLDKNGNWVTPYNMKPPVNSGADDFGITFFKNPINQEKLGYFTSSRHSSDDIFVLTKNRDINIDTPSDEEAEYNLFLAISVMIKNEDGSIQPASDAEILINGKTTDKGLNNKGFHVSEIMADTYQVAIKKNGYYLKEKSITTSKSDIPENQQNYTYNLSFVLEPIIENKEVVLKNIFYDFNKFNIRDDAKPALNDLSDLLLQNPEISIELSSHTDCIGNDEYNLKLSQKRAQAAVDYIISRGIMAHRIVAKGYGESLPAIDCECDACTDEERQLNRRTSFKVTEINK